jgi:hypothetical protein
MASVILSPRRAHALLDILSHHEAYQELRDLRIPGALTRSGPPFKTNGEENQMPLFHSLFSEFVVTLPGLRDVSTDFYQAKCQEIIEEFAKADLSESYEAGYIGIRKTLATAAAALAESPARGYYGGFPKKNLSRNDKCYDTSKPEDVIEGFNDFLQGLVYDDLLDELFAKTAETDKLEEQSPLLQAAHEYILVILASFLHYIFVLSPEGQTMLTMMKRANAIIPYTAIRQTLKVGNAATMINGMIRLVLTKITINSVTTFLGITNPSDAGWNLLQTIISTIVNWDTSELKRRSIEIEKLSDGPSKGQQELLKSYIEMDRQEHEKCRTMSEAKAEPIVVTVMDEYGGDEFTESQIPLALDYLSIHVSLRDRKHIANILCSRQPDLLTQAVREGVAAYDPIIRALHNAVDLSGTVGDAELFVNDLLKFAPSSKSLDTPTVGDFVRLLRKHQGSCHRFLHQVCKNGPELSEWYKEYAKTAARKFQINDGSEEDFSNMGGGGAGKLMSKLSDAVLKLPDNQQAQVLTECDSYAEYLANLSIWSESDLKLHIAPNQTVTDGGQNSATSQPNTRTTSPNRGGPGPGTFLRRWQAYINETSITPTSPGGLVRHGDDPSVVNAGRLPSSQSTKSAHLQAAKDEEVETAPRCLKTVELLAERFREILREAKIESDHK